MRTVIVLVFLVGLVGSSGCGTPQPSMDIPGGNATDSKGETKLTAAILDSVSDDVLEQKVIDNIWSKMKKDLSDEESVVSQLTQPQKTIYVIWLVEAEVNNGGFNQFYFNSSGKYADAAETAFQQIGAVQHADLMKRANNIYEKNRERLESFDDGTIDSFSKSYENNPLNRLDDEFYKLGEKENIHRLKIEFIRRNKDAFTP
jgi:hypothetical protein